MLLLHFDCFCYPQVHVTALPNGDLLLAFDDDRELRTPLALALSRDGGESWCGMPATSQMLPLKQIQ